MASCVDALAAATPAAAGALPIPQWTDENNAPTRLQLRPGNPALCGEWAADRRRAWPGLQWLGIRPPACLPTFLRLLLPCQLIAVGLPGVSSLSAGPIMPLAPKLFLEGTTERNTTLVSRLPMNRLLRVFGCCMLAVQAAAHVGLLHVGLCLRPWGSCCVLPSVATDIQRIGSVCSAALLQIPAANVMHTGYNTTSLIVSGPRPASATLLWLAASTAPHHFSPIQLHAPLSICACLILPACLPACLNVCPPALPCPACRSLNTTCSCQAPG